MKLKYFITFLWILVISTLPAQADFARGVVIRDQQIEDVFGKLMDPVIQAAGYPKDAVRLYVIIDPELNAFAQIGGQIFFHSGLILQSTVEEFLGVAAHELGHVVGNHVSRTVGIGGKVMTRSLVLSAVGGALMALAGSGEAAMGAVTLGMHVGERSFLNYSRGQEGSADLAAVKFLKTAGYPTWGLKKFLGKMEKKTYLSSSMQDPYMRSHPLDHVRMQALVRHTPADQPEVNAVLREGYEWVQLKIRAFVEPPAKLLRTYRDLKNPQHLMVQAIALHRKGQLGDAVSRLDQLLLMRPKDPYMWELKGQVHGESGQWTQARKAYETMRTIGLRTPLNDVMYATALEKTGKTPKEFEEAVTLVQAALSKDPMIGGGWRLLAILHGKLDQKGEMALALAEQALARGDAKQASFQATKAQKFLKKNSPSWIRAEDILSLGKKSP